MPKKIIITSSTQVSETHNKKGQAFKMLTLSHDYFWVNSSYANFLRH